MLDPECDSGRTSSGTTQSVSTISARPWSNSSNGTRARTANLLHTSPGNTPAVKLDAATRRTLEGVTIRERTRAMGHVRFPVLGGVPRCEMFGAAAAV